MVFTHRFQVRSLVFGSVAGVAEGLVTPRVLTQVGFLPRVAAQVDLQIFQPRERLLAALNLKRQQHTVKAICRFLHQKATDHQFYDFFLPHRF